MDKLDKTLKNIMGAEQPSGSSPEGKECLTEQEFAEYLDNLLNPEQKEKVEQHMAACEACLKKSVMFSRVINKLDTTVQTDAAAGIVEGAKRLVRLQSPAGMLEVVLEFGRAAVKVIKDTAGICRVPDPALLSTRSDEDQSKEAAAAHISKELGGIKVDISVEKTGDAACEIDVRTTDPASGRTLDDIRINLVSGEKERASYLTVKGHASFKNLSISTYTLQIIKGKADAGSVLINMTTA